MIREVVCRFLILVLVGSLGPATAKNMTVEEMQGKVRQIEEKDATCKVTLRDGTSLHGKISQSSRENFTINSNNGLRTVSSSDVSGIQKKGMNPAIKVAIVVGVVIGALMGMMYAQCGSGGC